jgi:hypothetical protein
MKDKDKDKPQIIRHEPAPNVSDEEFAATLYNHDAGVAPQFDEPHNVSTTGSPLHVSNDDEESAGHGP